LQKNLCANQPPSTRVDEKALFVVTRAKDIRAQAIRQNASV